MPETKIEIINNAPQISTLIDWLLLLHSPGPSVPYIYLDLEGIELSRFGSLSLITLLVDLSLPNSPQFVYLIDIHVLGASAFSVPGFRETGKTLNDIFQDASVPKVLFDLRCDADALFALYGVELRGVEDVQLMESAMRPNTPRRKFLGGLGRCIEEYIPDMLPADRAQWKLSKEAGERYFKDRRPGNAGAAGAAMAYDVFNWRPMPADIVTYCFGDVKWLPELRRRFWSVRGLRENWAEFVLQASSKRVEESKKENFQPVGRHMALAPWTPEQNGMLDRLWNGHSS